jgi:hypothetical protein
MKLRIKSPVTRSFTPVEAFEAHHPTLGTGTLYRYLSKDKKSLVARFFPREWWQGWVYAPANKGLDPSLDNTILREEMGLDHILGSRDVSRNFRITTATKLWLVDAGYEKGVLKFVLKRLSESHKFELNELEWDENDENLEEKAMAHINRWAWDRFPGCSVNIPS